MHASDAVSPAIRPSHARILFICGAARDVGVSQALPFLGCNPNWFSPLVAPVAEVGSCSIELESACSALWVLSEPEWLLMEPGASGDANRSL